MGIIYVKYFLKKNFNVILNVNHKQNREVPLPCSEIYADIIMETFPEVLE